MHALEALDRFVDELDPGARVLDVGSGQGEHAKCLRQAGFDVVTLDLGHPADIAATYPMPDAVLERFDGIWASHVVEHQADVGDFCARHGGTCARAVCWQCRCRPCAPSWWAVISISSPKGAWSTTSLWRVTTVRPRASGVYGYNLSVLVRNREADLPELTHDAPDMALLARFFPWPVTQGIDSRLGEVRW